MFSRGFICWVKNDHPKSWMVPLICSSIHTESHEDLFLLSTINFCVQQWHKRTTWPFHLSFDLAPFCTNSVTCQKKHGSFINPYVAKKTATATPPYNSFKILNVSTCLFLKPPSSPCDLKSPRPRLCLTNLTHGTLVVDLLRIFGGYSPLAS